MAESAESRAALREQVRAVRAFNRFFNTLNESLNAAASLSEFSLAEVRLLLMLASKDQTPASHLRAELALDSGYLSRMLTRLERQGLAVKQRSGVDGRRQDVSLTAAGRTTAHALDLRADEIIRTLLQLLEPSERQQLAESMRMIRQLLEPDSRSSAR